MYCSSYCVYLVIGEVIFLNIPNILKFKTVCVIKQNFHKVYKIDFHMLGMLERHILETSHASIV